MFKRLIKSRRFRSRTALLIAGVLILPMLLFFHVSFSGRPANGNPDTSAGTVFGEPVSWPRFRQELAWVRRQWANRLGEDLPEGLEGLITQYTWDRLMLLEAAGRERLRVTDEELAAFLQEVPGLQENGRFQPERYRRYVAAIGLTPTVFEAFVRDDLLIEKLFATVRNAVAVTDAEVREAFVQAQERRSVALIVHEAAASRDTVRPQITETELQAEYDAHPERVRIPEQISFAYVGLTAEELRDAIPISEEALADYHAQYPERFADEEGTPLALEEARELIRTRLLEQRVSQRLIALALDLEEALQADPTIEELADTHALTARTVGPIPVTSRWLPEGPEPAVLRAAVELAAGESELVETERGVFVVQVTRRDPARLPPLEEVRETLEEQVVGQLARQAARDAVAQLRGELATRLAQGEAFDEATRSLRVTPSTPAPFTRRDAIEGLGVVPAVTQAAFATPVGELSEVIEAGDRIAVLYVAEVIAPDEAAWTASAQAELREQFLREKQQARVAQWLGQLRELAQVTSHLEAVPADS